MALSGVMIIFVAFLSFFLFAIVRVFMLRILIPLPQNFIVVTIGIIFGFLKDNYFIHVNLEAISQIDPRIAMDIVLPVTMFMGGFFVNKEVFQRPGLHILMFLAVQYGLCLVILSFLVCLLLDWSWRDSSLLICIVLPPGTVLARTFLKRLTVSHKLETFLVGEALLSNIVAYFLFINMAWFGVKNYIHTEDVFHELLFGPLIGYLTATAVSYWLARIIKDIVNTVSIIVASVYFTFIIAQLLNTSAILAVVVMGIVMSGRQSTMEEQSEEDIFRILNVMANFFNCNLFITVGIHLYLCWSVYSSAADLINVFAIFAMMAGVRAAVVLLLSRFLHNSGFCLSANNLLVLVTCNIRGSLSILMCFFIRLKGFPVEYPEKMFAYALTQIHLSLLFNTMVSNLVIRYDVLAQYDESRERFISTIMDILDGIRYRSLSANRHGNLSFADADWHTVSKFTELKHPLITLPATPHQGSETTSPEQEEGRSIRRILTIAKCSYRKQYHEGLMSRNALKLLTQWTSHALAKGHNLIFPSKIASVLTIPTYYIFLLKSFGQRYNELTLETKTLGIRRAFVVVFYFVDMVMSVLALANVLVPDYSHRNLFFIIYNLAFICAHLFWIFVQSMVMRQIDLWNMMTLPIVIIGVLDISIFQGFTNSKSNVARALRAACVLTRFVRPIRLAGMFLMSLKPLMLTCDHMVSRRLMDGYDIGRSYIQARLEVVRLISHVEDVPQHLRASYKTALKHHKIEAVKMLGVMQLHCPSTLTTAKTRQATRIVLKRQEYIVRNIQQSRALGEDAKILENMILTRMNSVNTGHIKISHPDYTDIIMNVPWIKDMNEVYVQVIEKGEQVNFRKYEIIVSAYEDPGGIFIILEGLAWVMKENQSSLGNLSEMVTVDYLSSGSVIGEYTFLTGKPRHKTIGCYTDLMGIYVRNHFLYEVMGGRPTSLRPKLLKLEEKMWRVVALRIALRLLMGEPAWLPWSQSQILMRLVDSVLVDGTDTDKTFNDWIADYEIVLIQGKVKDLSSNEPLSAPAYIPKQRTTYAFMRENRQRPLMLAIPPVDECDLHVSTYDNPQQIHLLRPSLSQCTFSSGSSNNPPCWLQRNMVPAKGVSSVLGGSEASGPVSRLEMSFGRRALKSLSYPFTALLNKNFESPLVNLARKATPSNTNTTIVRQSQSQVRDNRSQF